jgi:hypothetical protein
MTRYFEQFFNATPMVELNEATARASGTYAEERTDGMRRFRCFLDHELFKVVYPGCEAPTAAQADLRARAEGVRGEVYTPVTRDAEGRVRYRTWHLDSNGAITKELEPELTADGRMVREAYRAADGELRSIHEYVYDREGELLEVVTRAPDGTVLNRQHT